METLDRKSTSEKAPFLLPEEEVSRRPALRLRLAFILHFLIASCYFILITYFVRLFYQNKVLLKSEQGLYSPASEAIEHAFKVIDLDAGQFATGNPFVGNPRPELDAAWDGLLKNIQIHVSPDEFDQLQPQLNRTSLRLEHGSGDYIIRLGVYHHLHCLKWVRKWIHREHYWPELEGEALHERRWHIEHCLESFRLSVMCTASLAPSTFYFMPNTSDPLKISVSGRHVARCANWEKLDDWAAERRIDFNDIDLITLA